MDSSWLKEANAITLVCGATTDLNPSEIVARYIGRLLCKGLILIIITIAIANTVIK